MKTGPTDARNGVAREAANLLYRGIEKEFKQAKLRAAEILKARFLPTNLEVAVEIDRIAEEQEGAGRKERLIRMRREAFDVMNVLKDYDPLLTGSVWRGTIKHDSDIDITVYSDKPEDVLEALGRSVFHVAHGEWMTVAKKGKRISTFHAYVKSPAQEKLEIKICSKEEASRKEKCEIWGDNISGLHVHELERLLKEDPTKRFLPL